MSTERLMDRNLYRAAESGNWEVIQQYEHQIGKQVTSINDNVLHILSRSCGSSLAVQEILARIPRLVAELNVDLDTPLHIAARKGHSNIVRAIIDVDLDAPLHIALRFRLLLRHLNRGGNTAFHEAIINKRREIIQLLYNKDPTLVDVKNGLGRNPLYLAAENGDEGVVDLILSPRPVTNYNLATCLINFRYCVRELSRLTRRLTLDHHDKRNALHAAAIGNFPGCLRLILRELPHLAGETDKFGWNALHYAARLNHLEVVREMLLSDSCRGQNKALRIAVKRGHIEVVEELLTHCPDCWSTITSAGKNIIHIAAKKEQQQMLNLVLRKSWASELVNGKDTFGNTPLHYYVRTERLLGCELLNHPAVQINALNKIGQTPLDRLRSATLPSQKRKDFLMSELAESGATESVFISSMEDDSETQSEEKMNKMAETYQVVATLIVAITFAAAFTVPGGYESNDGSKKGQPIFLKKPGFIVFIIFDYAALFFSWMALIGLLLHPRLKDHPRRNINLRLCGRTIIFSLVALFISFVSGLYITLPKKGMRIWLLLFPYLFFGPCYAMICNFLEEFGVRNPIATISDGLQRLQLPDTVFYMKCFN